MNENKEKSYSGDLNDKIEALKFISQVHRSQFNERRAYELKIVFTSLTFYVLCVAAKYNSGVNLPSSFKSLVWLLFLILALLVSVFLCFLHNANNKNKEFAENAENAINDMLKLSIFLLPNRDSKCQKNWALFWQIVALFSFAITSAFFLTLDLPPQNVPTIIHLFLP